jgi:hypothetical protein
MTTVSYSLSSRQMTNLMRLVDQGRIKIESLPERRESSEIQRFLKDYILEKSTK